ncbi:PREDICTED: muscular LMNA-interacting protein [Tinamus guttatus]|uniref:muscular LMNA-interacting protein n=1 Tax=Tinamus guttatus TaxID=94827 RepID=UPI00052E828B|nr:PREDICTED: muscular LMNA-interacting protein [Tinamus guttatus]
MAKGQAPEDLPSEPVMKHTAGLGSARTDLPSALKLAQSDAKLGPVIFARNLSWVDPEVTAAAAGGRSRKVDCPPDGISFPLPDPCRLRGCGRAWRRTGDVFVLAPPRGSRRANAAHPGQQGNKFLEQKLTISSHESGTKPLTFTFVPSIGQLPTHFEVVDVSKFLVRLPEDPKDLSCQETTYKSNTASDVPALKSGARQDSAHRILQPPSFNSNKAEMQENDLFKAEFILITDSGEEDEVSAASHSTQQAPNGYGPVSAQLLAPSHVSAGGEARRAPGDLHSSSACQSTAQNHRQQQYKIKTSYKAFAAIPTNTLLMEQKALDEPAKPAEAEGITLDTHSEMCSPAQLRQQTEELCAVIDQVLQDPLPMRRCESSPSFLQTTMESDVGKAATTLQRVAGRETRYASLYKSAPMVTESQTTKPGVIRPVLVKALKKEEPYQPNPFKKYLEEISDQDTEQPGHPIVPIPENETLSSEEVIR